MRNEEELLELAWGKHKLHAKNRNQKGIRLLKYNSESWNTYKAIFKILRDYYFNLESYKQVSCQSSTSIE